MNAVAYLLEASCVLVKVLYYLFSGCFMVPIPGWDQPHVVSIRSIEDCLKVQALVHKGAKSAVVIGGGVMGL